MLNLNTEAGIQEMERKVDQLVHALLLIICDAVKRKPAGRSQAVQDAIRSVVKSELKEFLFGDRYASEREAIMAESINPLTGLGSLALNCIERVENVRAITAGEGG